MGEKGARLTAEATALAEQLVGEWSPLGEVTTKKMFGGHGIFHNGKMFAMVDSSATVLFKAKGADSADLEAAGATKHGRMPYWTAPPAMADDEDALRDRAAKAIADLGI